MSENVKIKLYLKIWRTAAIGSLLNKAVIGCVIITALFSCRLLEAASLNESIIKHAYITIKKESVKLNSKSRGVIKRKASTNYSLSEQFNSKKLIFPSRSEKKSLEALFIKSFTEKVGKDSNSRHFSNESDPDGHNDFQSSETDQFSNCNDKIKEIDYTKQDIAMRAIWNSLGDVFRQTPLGKEVTKLTQTISRIFVIEYSKEATTEEANFYLPGQIPLEKERGEEAYKISLSPLFYSGTDSLNGHFSLALGFDYHDILTETVYDFSDQELTLNIENSELNAYFGISVSFCLMINRYDETSSLLEISLDF